MNEIKIYPIGKEEAVKAEPLLIREAAEAIKSGLPVTAFAAVKDGVAIGALAGAIDEDVFEIWSIYVEPDHRRQGAGRALINALEKLLEETESDKSDAASRPLRASYTSDGEDNGTLLPFFRAMGFAEDVLHHPMYYIGYLYDLKSREKLSARTPEKNGDSVLSFAEAGDRLIKTASNAGINQGYPVPEGGLLSDTVDRELSFCVVRDGKIMAYVTVEHAGEGLIEISSLWSGLDNPMEILAMLLRLIDALKESCAPDTQIVMLSTHKRIDKLIDYLFSYVEPRSYRMLKL